MKTLYNTLKPELKEKLETEIKSEYPTTYKKITEALHCNMFIINLTIGMVADISTCLGVDFSIEKMYEIFNR